MKDSKNENELKEFNGYYSNKENLWIFSFIRFLSKEMHRFVFEDKDYEMALIYNEVFLKLEKWIIKSGFLYNFSPEVRMNTKKRVSKEMMNHISLTKALEIILEKGSIDYVNSFLLTNTNSFGSDI